MSSPSRPGNLSPFQLFTMLFGTIVGVAWIVATGMWIIEAGPVGAVLAFGAGALVMWLIGLCFAEMMAMYPQANGSMAYVFEAFGERASAVAGWFLVLNYVATCAWYFVTLAWLVEALLPWVRGAVAFETPLGVVRVGDLVLGLAGTVAITAVNLRGVAARAVFQDVLVVAKIVIAFALFASAAALGHGRNLEPHFAGEDVRAAWIGILSVAVATPFFFAGFDVLPQAVRDRRPGMPLKVLATVIGLATLAAFVFYGGAILAASVSLERSELREASLPVFEAFRTGLGQPWLAALVIVAGISGVLTGWNANLLSAARVLQGMAQAGATVPFFAADREAASGGTVAVRAVLLVSSLSILVGLLGRNALGPIVDMAAIPLLVVFALVCAGLIKLRREQPEVERPYRVPGGLALPVLALTLSLGLIAAALISLALGARGTLQWALMLLWGAVGLVFWCRASAHRAKLSLADRKRRLLQGEE
jgi:APA family basic amino acid/polyamine antiporter